MKHDDIPKPIITLTKEQRKIFETELKLAMYSQMYKNNLLTAEQLRQLIVMNRAKR